MAHREMLEEMEKGPGFFHHNNYHVVEADENNCEIRADLTENSMNPYGMAHGGLIFGLGDVVMGMVAKSTGRSAVTLNANINYLKPGFGKYITAKAELVKATKKVCFLKSSIYNDKEELIATMDGTYYFID